MADVLAGDSASYLRGFSNKPPQALPLYHNAQQIKQRAYQLAQQTLANETKRHTQLSVRQVADEQQNEDVTLVTTDTHNPKAVAFIEFGQHAREQITSEVAYHLVEALALGERAELWSWASTKRAMTRRRGCWVPSELGQALRDVSIALLPISGLSGRRRADAGEFCLRHDGNTDPNRNFPTGWRHEDGSEGEQPLSIPTSRLSIKAFEQVRNTTMGTGRDDVYTAYINVHSGEWSVYTPWDHKTTVSDRLSPWADHVISRLDMQCRCTVGGGGAVSGYLAFGSAMDHMHTAYGADAFTIEVYGPRLLGRTKVPGGRPVTEDPRRHRRRLSLLFQRDSRCRRRRSMLDITKVEPGIAWEMPRRSERQCFAMFNPVNPEEYRDVVGSWAVALLDVLSGMSSEFRDASDPSLTLEAAGPGVRTDVAYEHAADHPNEVTVPDALELRDRLERHSQHTWRGADSMAMFRPGGEGARYGAPVMLVISAILALCCARQAFLWFGGRRKESCKNT